MIQFNTQEDFEEAVMEIVRKRLSIDSKTDWDGDELIQLYDGNDKFNGTCIRIQTSNKHWE